MATYLELDASGCNETIIKILRSHGARDLYLSGVHGIDHHILALKVEIAMEWDMIRSEIMQVMTDSDPILTVCKRANDDDIPNAEWAKHKGTTYKQWFDQPEKLRGPPVFIDRISELEYMKRPEKKDEVD